MTIVSVLVTIVSVVSVVIFYKKNIPKVIKDVNNLTKSKDRPNTKSINLKLLRKVASYLNNGDISSAKTLLKEGSEFTDLHLNKMLEIVIIEQKYGQIDSAIKHYEIAKSKAIADKNNLLIIQLELIKFKLESQKGNLQYIFLHAKSLIQSLEKIKENQKIPSVLNRLGVYYATQEDAENAKNCFNKSIKISKKQKQKHTEITTRMFIVTSQVLCQINLGVDNPLKEIIKIQEDYIFSSLSEKNLDLYQVHLLKSIVQTLFCESAILYMQGCHNKAFFRLCAANLLVVPAKTSPETEGYSDLLNLVRNDKLKKLLTSAMSTSDSGREVFLKSIGASSIFLSQLQELVKPDYTILKKNTWYNFRNFIYLQDKNEDK